MSELARLEVLVRQLQGMVPLRGEGSPENVEVADIGRMYIQTDGGAGTVLWVKEADSGLDTGWQSK